MLEKEDYRDLLKRIFFSLKEKNRRESLGRLSKKTKLDDSFLSLILNKKRHVDVKKLKIIADAFKMSDRQRIYFYLTYLSNLADPNQMDGALVAHIEEYKNTPESKINYS